MLRLSGDSEKILNAVICKPHKGMACVLRPSPDIQIFDTGLLSLAAVRSLWEHASPAVLRPAASPTAVSCHALPAPRTRTKARLVCSRQLADGSCSTTTNSTNGMRGSPDQAVTLLTPYPGMIEAREVGADVGNVKNNRPELME